MTRFQIYLSLCGGLTLLIFSGCKVRPRYVAGDHLIPLGSSDPAQIVTVVAVEPDAYRVALSSDGARTEARPRQQIDSDYVRVDLPVGGSWTRREDLPTPNPTATPRATAVPSPTATPRPSARVDLETVAETVRPAFVAISFFDATGKLTSTTGGLFVSEDGKIIAPLAPVGTAVNAVAKAANGKIFNVIGVLASSATSNLALLKAEATRVPFIATNKLNGGATGARVGIIDAASRRPNNGIREATIAALSLDDETAPVGLAGENLSVSAGSVLVDEQGKIAGFATANETAAPFKSIASGASLAALLAQSSAETTARWPAAPAATPTPTATPSASPKPSATPAGARGEARLLYAPQPRYPSAARFSYRRVEGSGRYVVNFDATGKATNVQTISSSGSDALDNAAIDTLRTWRAQPGRPAQRVVTIPFKRPTP